MTTSGKANRSLLRRDDDVRQSQQIPLRLRRIGMTCLAHKTKKAARHAGCLLIEMSPLPRRSSHFIAVPRHPDERGICQPAAPLFNFSGGASSYRVNRLLQTPPCEMTGNLMISFLPYLRRYFYLLQKSLIFVEKPVPGFYFPSHVNPNF